LERKTGDFPSKGELKMGKEDSKKKKKMMQSSPGNKCPRVESKKATTSQMNGRLCRQVEEEKTRTKRLSKELASTPLPTVLWKEVERGSKPGEG